MSPELVHIGKSIVIKGELNDLAEVTLRLSEPLAVDPYPDNRTTGAFVLVDEATNETVAAGMVVSAT